MAAGLQCEGPWVPQDASGCPGTLASSAQGNPGMTLGKRYGHLLACRVNSQPALEAPMLWGSVLQLTWLA